MKSSQKAYLKNTLEEGELDSFIKALARDQTILPALLKILDRRFREVDNRDDLLDDPNYPVKRPYLDGRFRELRWLRELLTQNEEDSDESSTGTRSVGRQ